jgi:hypothetical protein
MRTLRVEQTTAQGVLQTLDSGMADLGANQSALEQSFQTLSNSVKSLAKNKFYPDQDEAFKSLLEYINNTTVK